MLQVRKSADRGHFNHGWLDTYHTFSFGDYFDPQQMQFRTLRVINEDRIAPGAGFGRHPHRDMEIVTLVLSGALEHQDSLGSGEVLRPGELQHMSAGTGIEHSEFNPSQDDETHLYQIWLRPRQPGLAPRYGQRKFDSAARRNAWQLVASADGRDESLPMQTDADVYLADLAAGSKLAFDFPHARHGWLQVLRGTVSAGGTTLTAGDGLAISDEPRMELAADEPCELLLFDLP